MIKGWIFALLTISANLCAAQEPAIWMELAAKDKWARTELIDQGYDIVAVEEDRVIVLGDEKELLKAQKQGIVLAQYLGGLSPFDFPAKDEKFTNYQEMTAGLTALASYYPNLVQLQSLGKTIEQREMYLVRISALASGTANVPASILMGGHHAREHVSIEMSLHMVQYLVEQFSLQNPRIVSLLNSMEIFIIPMVNPDGAEYDIATGSYRSWRKNRRANGDGTYGVDLNRNYGFGWGGPGASTSTQSDTYRGPSAFSENETQMIKKFIDEHSNIKTLLSYHTFSKLVLWPWGHQEQAIANTQDQQRFQAMGEKMAKMNGYKPMQSSELYVASGDTCDWAYGTHGIFAFTFELDPANMWEGGFYPGQGILESVFQKNIEPTLYLIESALQIP